MLKLNNHTLGGNCSSCGNCCSDILHLDNEEILKIDKYLKEHNIKQFNKGENNLNCPFRNELMRKCEIYEVRPYICKLFKCNISPEQAEFNRDELNKNKLPRSMALLFFNDNSKQKNLKKLFNITVYGRK